MRQRSLLLCGTAALLLASSIPGLADDGENTIKRLTGTRVDNQLTVQPDEVFGSEIPEAEHAFTDMLQFYVPTQRASGLVEPIEYFDVDGNLVETLETAKPLVNVFLYGPAVEVEGTAFLHSFMDSFAAVSLDDGETWKTTNLSQSADQTSFTLGTSKHGGNHAVSDSVFLESAEWIERNKNVGRLNIVGEVDNDDGVKRVQIINADTGDDVFAFNVRNNTTEFDLERVVRAENAPCRIAAVVDGEVSAPVPVSYSEETEAQCSGLDLTEYPGGAYSIAQASSGNKAMVAWTSRYCQQGQPGYSIAWDGTDEGLSDEQLAKRTALETLLALGLPLVLLLPLTIGAIWILLHFMLGPLRGFRDELAARDGRDLGPVATGTLPTEILPVAEAVNALLERLQSTLMAERSFAANAAHELRTPVAAALAQTQRLQVEAADENTIERANNIESALKRLNRMSEKLMQMARAEGASLRMEAPHDLTIVLQMVVQDLAYADKSNQIELTLPERPALSRIDPDAFAIAARNLIENALRHGQADRPVQVSLQSDGTLTVVNTSPVIPPDDLAKLTQRFMRQDRNTDGSGLGLSIVQLIADGAGGALELRSPAPNHADGFAAIFHPAKA